MEVVFAKSYIKDLRNLPGHIITAADEIADKLHKAKSLQESGVDYKKNERRKKLLSYKDRRLQDCCKIYQPFCHYVNDW